MGEDGAIADAVLDLLAGSTCVGCRRPGRQLCRACAGALPLAPAAVRPTPCPPGLATTVAAGEYAGVLKSMVLGLKEHHRLPLARQLGHVLALSVTGLVGARPGAPIVLVPVPSRPGAARRRGHEPTRDITRRAAAVLRSHGVEASVARLLRVAPVADQRDLGATARAANLAGAMRVDARRLAWLARRRRRALVVVCDDVLTTGSTAREAQRALASYGVEVAGIAVVAATRRRRDPSSGHLTSNSAKVQQDRFSHVPIGSSVGAWSQSGSVDATAGRPLRGPAPTSMPSLLQPGPPPSSGPSAVP